MLKGLENLALRPGDDLFDRPAFLFVPTQQGIRQGGIRRQERQGDGPLGDAVIRQVIGDLLGGNFHPLIVDDAYRRSRRPSQGIQEFIFAPAFRGNRHGYGKSQAPGQPGRIDVVPFPLRLIGHIEVQDERQTRLNESQRQQECSPEILGIPYLQDGRDLIGQEGPEGNQFLLTAGHNTANSRCVNYMVVHLSGLPGTDLHRRARVVGHNDILAGQERKDFAFPNIRVTDQDETPFLPVVFCYRCRVDVLHTHFPRL